MGCLLEKIQKYKQKKLNKIVLVQQPFADNEVQTQKKGPQIVIHKDIIAQANEQRIAQLQKQNHSRNYQIEQQNQQQRQQQRQQHILFQNEIQPEIQEPQIIIPVQTIAQANEQRIVEMQKKNCSRNYQIEQYERQQKLKKCEEYEMKNRGRGTYFLRWSINN
ncbi:unnamed protein product [Paramecium sonneborni]|uniref:Uncharacterized protein n=1 Tax=Paramecium sonneborni TaxID=65129 RepID=A0A8S1PZ26_9CILI|nr:unnamed protein product [Paramecium sonneborni]